MSAAAETDASVVENSTPAEVPAVEEDPQPQMPDAPAEKPVKEKKPKAPKEKKPRAPKTSSHPPYFEMIKEALLALNERSGSSPYAIAKHMEENHKAVLPANFRKILGLQLKNSAARGKLIKIKASYKLADKADTAAVKKPKQAKATTQKAAKKRTGTVRKKTAAAAKPAKKKVGAKKKAKKSAPAKAKQPKSIKSTSAKKAKKA
ncbi:histone H1 [Malania oleifera]|uniref:histone H1 n=1 Tax=Malania oleifera TaxID=397392 RepID=UPI0025AE2E4C|nr:histone H1 [Malania oleifera]